MVTLLMIKDNNPENIKDKFVDEIKVLRAVNTSLHNKITSLEMLEYRKEATIKEMRKKIEDCQKKIDFLESERSATTKRYLMKIKQLEREKRRNDMFNKKIIGTSKSAKEALMITEMDSLRAVNRTLLEFIDILSVEIGFDKELITKISEIASSVDDNIIKLFVNGLKSNKDKTEEVIVNEIEVERK